MDGEDRVLLVGSADRLAPAARSVITGEHRGQKGLRTAVRLVERIEHEKAATPLEALVREHSLLLEHRPPYNRWRCAPESYLYIRAGGGPLWSELVNHSPRTPLAPEPGGEPGSRDGLIIGPFRRRSSARAAVELLQRLLPGPTVRLRCGSQSGQRCPGDRPGLLARRTCPKHRHHGPTATGRGGNRQVQTRGFTRRSAGDDPGMRPS